MDYLLLFISTVLVNNIVLVKFLGLCPLMGVSNKLSSAFGMGLATTFVLTLSALASWVIEHLVLVPLDIEFLRILSFILIIAAVVQFTEAVVRKTSPLLHKNLGVFLPLITTNCAVLGVALLNVTEEYSLTESLVFGMGSAIGFSVVLLIFAGLRERIALANVPETFAGTPVSLVTAGLLSLVFMGFSGMI
jgi:electron transport complex protein RnfA